MCKITMNAILVLLLCATLVNAQENAKSGYKPRPKEFEMYQFSNDSIIQLKMPPETGSRKTFESKLPYPILFIHGLNSNSETWTTTTNYLDSQYSFTYGGRFDFCLNANDNNTSTNKNMWPTAGADIAAFESSAQNGDYYYVNFDVGTDGSFGPSSSATAFALSNQSAIAKQGIAVKKAIERVLQLTGKDKVILVGHSMGGLASREYIQNPANWQPDNKHHVAKLLTAGTPHGGSNMSGFGFGGAIGMDESSEAVRDLRTSYYYSGEPGRFLFGGTEIQNASNMNDNSYTPDFYNVDLNCNEIVNENIQGLNQKAIDNLIDFSSVIGRKNGGSTDGVVEETAAKMDNFYPGLDYPTKYFYYSAFAFVELHTALPSQYYHLMQGMDEPNVKELAYQISTNKNYIGFTTVQATSSADNDYYKFVISDASNTNVVVSNIVTSSMNATILDANGTAVGIAQNNTGATLNFSRSLTPGTYFLKITSVTPTNTNYQTPYNFTITSTLNNSLASHNPVKFYPNPVKDKLTIENISISKASIYSVFGQQLAIKEFDNSVTSNIIDLSSYPKGIYMITLENGSEQQTIKIAKE
nr:alpha/beta fold hydrolase [uncultured Flavobacterium sp.]